MYRLSVFDEIIVQTPPTFAMSLNFNTVTTTAREILQKRIEQDCYNANIENEQKYQTDLAQIIAQKSEKISQLSERELTLNGEKAGNFFRVGLQKQARLDWQIEFEKAVQSFAKNGFLLFIDDEQILDLDQPVQIKADNTSAMTFIRLIPLQGG